MVARLEMMVYRFASTHPANAGELLYADVTKRGRQMKSRLETLTPPNTPNPIGPYSHIAKVGEHIWIGGTAGVDPATGQLAGTDIGAQTRQILKSFIVMLEAVGSDLEPHHAHQYLPEAHVRLRGYERGLCRDHGRSQTGAYGHFSPGPSQARRIAHDESHCGHEGAIRIATDNAGTIEKQKAPERSASCNSRAHPGNASRWT